MGKCVELLMVCVSHVMLISKWCILLNINPILQERPALLCDDGPKLMHADSIAGHELLVRLLLICRDVRW